ncbi:hypothetical protein ACERK3_13355 [Phycisphaerales bacterium AB-hyl4]|uniref:Uncharacterized protein n=1 Tax=Natronomicrosphaera hydrolytica TaxID=3242702 RepID=A0ABV4U7L5_9BACT
MMGTTPLSLLLVAMLAFATPAAHCCAALADEAPDQSDSTPLPPCHPPQPQPADNNTPCNEPGSDCTDACQCSPLLRSACKTNDAPPLTTAPSYPQPSAPTAALLPIGMHPHTLGMLTASPAPDVGSPPTGAPSLLALNCQLTL